MDLSVTLHKSIRQRNKDEIVTDGLETGTVQVRMDEESARIKGVQKNALVMSMGISSAFAADEEPTYKITVTNENPRITIAGKTYTAYKLFDATYSGTAVAYSINTDSYFYKTAATKAILDDYFTFTAAAGDTQNMVVTAKDSFSGEAKARELADKLQPYLNLLLRQLLVQELLLPVLRLLTSTLLARVISL